MSSPVIDVVVLTWNDGPMLDVAVRSALDSADVEVRVIVVDNGSEPAAIAPDDPRVTTIRNTVNRGVAAGRNQGVRAGSSPLVCLLDSDARLHERSLAVLAGQVTEDDGIGLVSPVFDGQAPEASGGGAPTLGRKLSRVAGRTDTYGSTRVEGEEAWDVDFTIGACQLFRRSAYEAVDGLDESFFYGPEDADFCMRLRLAGWRVQQVAGAGCEHPPRRRNRRLLTRRGLAHGWAVARFLWRHRSFRRRVAAA